MSLIPPSPNSLAPPDKVRVLVVDDDPLVRRTHARVLEAEGWEVVVASDGNEALAQVRSRPFDTVVSDISMPGLDGLALLRAVREHDLDLPVVLVTGEPSISRASQAIEYGAFRFLSKPVEPAALVQSVTTAAAFVHAARIRREALGSAQSGDRAALEVCFGRALDKLWIAYQPIVRWSDRSLYAYEALVRSTEPALPHPGALLDAADQLNKMMELGRRIRELTVPSFASAAQSTRLFVNLHVSDLEDELLLSSTGPLMGIASRVTLEITERAALNSVDEVRNRIQSLRNVGYQIALDDLGAGYAGLSSFALLEPEMVKLDMSLVRDIHLSRTKQKLVASMVKLCGDLKHGVLAEGVETVAERDVLIALGCDLFQGFLFAKPGRPFPTIQWEPSAPAATG